MFKRLKINLKNYDKFKYELKKLIDLDYIAKTRGGKYVHVSSDEFIEGILHISKTGRGFVDNESCSVFIGTNKFLGALNGDKVKVKIEHEFNGKASGKIIKVLVKSNEKIQGFLIKRNNIFFLKSSYKYFEKYFHICNFKNLKLEEYMWVEARIIRNGKSLNKLSVEILKIIGDSKDSNLDLNIIASKFNLDIDFSFEINSELKQLKNKHLFLQKNRVDIRNLPTFTIDPSSAKDHDDAISFKVLDSCHEVGVHIADVSEYVIENSEIDIMAKKRGTSVYFPDKSIPMLPYDLSSDLCSLKEGKDRLAISLFVILDNNYDIINFELKETLINVDKRFNYNEVDNLSKNDSFYDTLKKLKEITESLRKDRFENGSLDFNIPETKIIIDDNGIPINIFEKKTLASHNIIEELMLLANKIIAKEFGSKFIKFPFRNHEEPSQDDLDNVYERLYNSNLSELKKAKLYKNRFSLKDMFGIIKGEKVEKLFSQLALKALPKANYYYLNKGHYGLSYKYYCHFTSPIRRYPDIIVHRFLKENIKGKKYKFNNPKVTLESCSKSEVNAMNAERSYRKRKQLRYLNKYIGKIFSGVISNLNSKGLFIQLNKILIDGFIPLKNIEDDFYFYNFDRHVIKGRRYKKEYHIGDSLEIKIIDVNIHQEYSKFKILD